MSLAYARKGLLGVLTPQANTTVGAGIFAAAAAGDGSAKADEEEVAPAESHSASSTSRYCMWMDRYGERQLAPGVWLARFKELHQPYAGWYCLRL